MLSMAAQWRTLRPGSAALWQAWNYPRFRRCAMLATWQITSNVRTRLRYSEVSISTSRGHVMTRFFPSSQWKKLFFVVALLGLERAAAQFWGLSLFSGAGAGAEAGMLAFMMFGHCDTRD